MKRLERFILGAGLLVLPFVFSISGAEQMREPKEHAFEALVGILLGCAIGRRISYLLGAGVAIASISSVAVSRFFPSAALFALLAAAGSCLFIAEAKEDDIERGLEVLELSGILCAAYGLLLQPWGRDPILSFLPGADTSRVFVFFGQHTLYGPFAAGAFASALFRGGAWRAIILLVPVFFIDASFTYLSFGVAIALFAVYRFGRPAAAALILAALMAAVFIGPKVLRQENVQVEALKDNGRFGVWRITWRLVKGHPFVGHGIGSFRSDFPLFQDRRLRELGGVDDAGLSEAAKKVLADADFLRRSAGIFSHPHNEPLLLLYEFGWGGLALGLALALEALLLWWSGPRAEKDWALLAILLSAVANSMGNFAFHLFPQVLLPLWAFVAIVMRGRIRA